MKGSTYPRHGLHGAVVHDIGVRILSGELKPGEALPTEDELTGDVLQAGAGGRPAQVRVEAREGEVVDLLVEPHLGDAEVEVGDSAADPRVAGAVVEGGVAGYDCLVECGIGVVQQSAAVATGSSVADDLAVVGYFHRPIERKSH